MEPEAYPNTQTFALAILLVLLYAIPSTTMQAQQTPPSPISQLYEAAASPFTDLDHTELTTGLLAERGGPFFSYYPFAQNLSYDDSLLATVSTLQIGALTTWTMAYDFSAVNSWLPQGNWYKDRQRKVSDTIFLGALLTQYDQLAEHALDSNLITLDTVAGKVFDVAGRTASPYSLDTGFLMTTLTQRPTGQTVSFYLDARDWLTNVPTATPVQLKVNGVKLPIALDSATLYTFPTTDTFRLTLTAQIGSESLQAHGRVVVPPPARPSMRMNGSDSLVTDVDGGGGTLRIYYNGNCGTALTKTIIFVGGLDPEDNRGYHEVTLPKLLEEIENTGTDYDNNSVSELLDADGYDIIFLDWNDGDALLTENGEVVARAIQTIDRLKAEDGDYSKSIIVGQSMGGICTRIGIHILDSLHAVGNLPGPPNIEKFISWDSPHRGANVPVSLQAAISFLAGDVELNGAIGSAPIRIVLDTRSIEGIGRAWDAHNAPAARQLKLFHTNLATQLDFSHFNNFQTYYQSFDISVPHMAMSNGSSTDGQEVVTPINERQIFPGEELFSVQIGGLLGRFNSSAIEIAAEYLPGRFEVNYERYLFGAKIINLPVFGTQDLSDQLPNYDIMPASITDAGISELPPLFGNLFINFTRTTTLARRYYAYVPTQSAQNLPISNTPSNATAGFDVDRGVTSRSESVNRPARLLGPTSGQNHDHVSFTPS